MADHLRNILRFRFYLLAASTTLIFVASGSLFLISVTLKDLAAEFGWPREVPSLAFALQFLGGGCGGIVMGYALDRLGAAVPPLTAAVSVASGAVLTVFVETPAQLYAIYLVLFGFFGQGSLYAPMLANIARWYERRRGMVVGIVASGQSLAGIVWPAVFGHVVAWVGWRDGYLGFGVFAACVMLPLVAVFVREPPPPEMLAEAEALESEKDGRKPRRGPRRSRMPFSHARLQIILCVAILGCCIAMAMPLAHLVSHATDKGLALTNAVEILSVTLMAAFVSRVIVVGFLSDRFGALWALFCFSGVQAITLGLLTFADTVYMLYIVGIGFGLGYGGIFPVYAILIREYMPPMEAGRRTGLVFLFGAASMGFGSWFAGALFDATGDYVLPFLIGVAANAANLVIVAALLTRSRPAGNEGFAPGVA